MNISELIIKNKAQILPELISWVETFNPENIIYDKNNIEEEDEEQIIKSYKQLSEIILRLESNQSTTEDFVNIFFQINQMKADEVRIQL
jgi:hypothetical protein